MKNWTLALTLGAAVATTVIGLGANPTSAAQLVVDFNNGQPPSSVLDISKLTPATGLDFSGGSMNINMPSFGDGVQITAPGFDVICSIYDELNLAGFPLGTGVEFDTIFGDFSLGNRFETQFINSGSFIIKIREIKDNVVIQTQTQQVELDSLANIKTIRFDWLRKGPISEAFYVEYRLRDGTKRQSEVQSSVLKHDQSLWSSRIINFNVTQDPSLSIGKIILEDEHVSVPERTSTLSLLALGTFGAASTLKRKLKPSKSSGKETTKVS